MTTLPLAIALAWTLAVLMHWWPRLAAAWRLRASVATSAAGVGCLVAAVQAEGLRETALTSMVLVGPATLTATASASASLYYYVLTAACLLLGFAGLAFGDPLARWLSPRPLPTSVAVAWGVTVVRFLLEKSAAPALLVQALGVTWLAPVAGAYFATALPGRPGWRPVLRPLLAYAFLVRGFVAVVALVATRFSLGSHYDMSGVVSVPVALTGDVYGFVPGGWRQALWLILVPQLVVWPAFTVVAGMLGAAVVGRLPRPARGVARAGA
ncbi:MAG TPA: hypothetical protein VLF95_06065 [Vicinamibacteria bacterium]|nr:hypothetical protein [Vicinamibacteria bacterium]